jgi:fibronectin type 3 domain-containing protein
MSSGTARLSSLIVMAVLLGGCEDPLAPDKALFGKVGTSKLAPPSGTNAIPMLSDRVDVFWTDNSTNEGGFRVERSTNGGASWLTAYILPANSTAVVDEGRSSERRVCYRIIATTGRGTGAASAPSPTDCTTPPAAPTELTATALSSHAVDLAWRDNSRVEDGYYLTRSTRENPSDETLIAEPPADATSYHDTGLRSGTTYNYRVRAKKDGGLGSQSNVATAATPPGPPGPPSDANAAALGGGTVHVRWSDHSVEGDGFRLERALSTAGPWEGFRTTSPNVTETYDYNRPLEQATCYRVIAFNRSGDSEASNSDCAVTPAAPSNLTARAADESAVDLTWSDNSAVEDGYEVERNYATVAVLGPNVTSYQDAGLAADVAYQYRVRARKEDGFSSYSDVVTAVTGNTPPDAPADAHAMPGSSTSVTLSWWHVSENEEGFRIERSTNGGATWLAAGTTGPAWTMMWFTDDGQQSEQEVCYRVIAFNGRGDSGPSNTVCTVPPAAPTELSGRTVNAQTIELQWEDNSSAEDGYEIWIATAADFFPIATVPRNSTSARIPPWTSATAYAVAAGRDGGTSDFACCVWAGELSGLQATSLPSVQRRIRDLLRQRRARGRDH